MAEKEMLEKLKKITRNGKKPLVRITLYASKRRDTGVIELLDDEYFGFTQFIPIDDDKLDPNEPAMQPRKGRISALLCIEEIDALRSADIINRLLAAIRDSSAITRKAYHKFAVDL